MKEKDLTLKLSSRSYQNTEKCNHSYKTILLTLLITKMSVVMWANRLMEKQIITLLIWTQNKIMFTTEESIITWKQSLNKLTLAAIISSWIISQTKFKPKVVFPTFKNRIIPSKVHLFRVNTKYYQIMNRQFRSKIVTLHRIQTENFNQLQERKIKIKSFNLTLIIYQTIIIKIINHNSLTLISITSPNKIITTRMTIPITSSPKKATSKTKAIKTIPWPLLTTLNPTLSLISMTLMLSQNKPSILNQQYLPCKLIVSSPLTSLRQL